MRYRSRRSGAPWGLGHKAVSRLVAKGMQYNTVLYVLCVINTYNTQYTAYPRVLCNPDLT